MYNLDFSILLNDYKAILNGIYLTVLISAISSLISFILGSFFVYLRTFTSSSVKKSSDFCVSCIRNTPLLIIIYIFYKGLPSIGITLPAITCGISALSIYTAAYISDALLSGIKSVHPENTQAGLALGLTKFQTFIYIIYPQALRYSTFILGSQFMNLVKNSSLVSFIAVADIFYVTEKGIANNYRIYEYFILAIVVYCSLTGIVLAITNFLKKHFEISGMEAAL